MLPSLHIVWEVNVRAICAEVTGIPCRPHTPANNNATEAPVTQGVGPVAINANSKQAVVGDIVQLPWGRKLWCATVVAVDHGKGWVEVDWLGFPAWKKKRVKLQGVRHPVPEGASCVGLKQCCPSHHLTLHWAHCNKDAGCTCKECCKQRHADLCFVCGKHGKILMCDGENCSTVAHIKCVGLREVPVGEWYCPPCCPLPASLPWPYNSKPNVISLFDGIAIGRQALLHLGFRELGGYHAFELSHNAMAVANSNHSDITQHGDVGEVGAAWWSCVCCPSGLGV